ncbi:hypothetical protein GCM10010166_50980 [Couchioplanes caeruleus subsp. azureus]|nr:hypothetical protein GCM10010166_50980 [Couchioplanes caeruleus subsp. azureus]
MPVRGQVERHPEHLTQSLQLNHGSLQGKGAQGTTFSKPAGAPRQIPVELYVNADRLFGQPLEMVHRLVMLPARVALNPTPEQLK